MLPVVVALLLIGGTERDAPKKWIVDHPGTVLGASTGALAGFAVGIGAVGAVSATCIPNGSCPWGYDGGAVIGAFMFAPVAGAAMSVVGAVVGGVFGSRFNGPEASGAPAEAGPWVPARKEQDFRSP